MTQVDGSNRSAFAPVGDAIRDLRAAEATLRAEQQGAWERYLAQVDRILADDLRTGQRSEVDEVTHQLFEGIRMRLDDLRVQVRLGTMEGEDLLAQLRSALGHLVDTIHLPAR